MFDECQYESICKNRIFWSEIGSNKKIHFSYDIELVMSCHLH